MTTGGLIKRGAGGERLAILLLTLCALVLRLYALDAKGLAYDEAATALMARATPAAIILFHWEAAFEHPPLWQLLMHFWSRLAGQREFALRFLPALAGVVVVPLVWQLAQRLKTNRRKWQTDPPSGPSLVLVSALLAVIWPILLLYSQEARMYTLVVALALASLWTTVGLLQQGGVGNLLAYLLVTWLMLGLHYYSVLLVVAVAVGAVLVLLVRGASVTHWARLGGALALAVAPLALWMALAPGFQATVAAVLLSRAESQPGLGPFLNLLWRDLSFGAIRWSPLHSWLGYAVLPLALIGGVVLTVQSLLGLYSPNLRSARPGQGRLMALLVMLAIAIPLLISAAIFHTLATRYLLFVAPLLCLLCAAGIRWLGQVDWRLGALWLAVALGVAGAGLLHYFTSYEKSGYRSMAQTLTQQAQPGDGILLEGPRQHLLAKYYLPADLTYYTAPAVTLPDYWPVNAPPVVPEEMDDRIQEYIRRHRVLWLVLTAEDEVDRGEFVAKYLTAVSYRVRCQAWIDVRLCQLVSPHYTKAALATPIQATFGNELLLQDATLTTVVESDGAHFLLVTLNWLAQRKPTTDYRVSLRLLSAEGVLLSQQDDYPIGPLLPPTTWQAGDAKPGYMTLSLPAPTQPGRYRVVVGLYDPVTQKTIAHSDRADLSSVELLELGQLEADAEMDGYRVIRGED